MSIHFFLAFGYANGFESPYISIIFTDIPSIYFTGGIGVFQDFLTVVRKQQVHAVVKIFNTVPPSQIQFKTGGLHIRIVHFGYIRP